MPEVIRGTKRPGYASLVDFLCNGLTTRHFSALVDVDFFATERSVENGDQGAPDISQSALAVSQWRGDQGHYERWHDLGRVGSHQRSGI